MKKALRALAALLIGIGLFPAFAQGDTVNITSVDNYGGTSNVYTDRPNTTITVTSLDQDGKPIESWTGTTDEKGRITIKAGYNLSKPYLRAKVASLKTAEMPIITPSEIGANEPFTFAVTGRMSGEVVQLQSVSGEVVATARADDLGRVFLPAGLVAGAYSVISNNSAGQRPQIIVKPKPNDALVRPGDIPILPVKPRMQVIQPTGLKLDNVWNLRGEGFSPNAADMVVRLGDVKLPVLASSGTNMVVATLAPQGTPIDVKPIRPGWWDISITNVETGERVETCPVFVYQLDSEIEKRMLTNGEQTFMRFGLMPKNATAELDVSIIDGPVHFDGGKTRATVNISDGLGQLPLNADPRGLGRFNAQFAMTSMSCSFTQDGPNEYGGKSYFSYGRKGTMEVLSGIHYDANGVKRREATYVEDGGQLRRSHIREWDANGNMTESEDSNWHNGQRTSGTRTTYEQNGNVTNYTWNSTTNSWVPTQ